MTKHIESSKIVLQKRITQCIDAKHRCRTRALLLFGDKEIAVRVRGNSHYRNLTRRIFLQSPSRNAYRLRLIKDSWAIGDVVYDNGYGQGILCCVALFVESAFILSFFCNYRKERIKK